MPQRKTDEQDSTVSVWGNYFTAILVTGGVFAVEIFLNRGWLDGALIGVLITKIYDGISKQNEYFFPNKRDSTPKHTPQTQGETDAEQRRNA